MAQVVGLRPYSVGGVYAQHRNAASVRRNSGLGWVKSSFIVTPHGLGDSGGCDPMDSSCQMAALMGNIPAEISTGMIPNPATAGGNIGTITIGVLILYMVTAFMATK